MRQQCLVCVGLPAAFSVDGHVSPHEPSPCLLERLCELHDGLVVEAKGIKQHYFKPYIQKLFQRRVSRRRCYLPFFSLTLPTSLQLYVCVCMYMFVYICI